MTPVSNDDLKRFVEAQDALYEQVCDELRAGAKTRHWMWFVFPQLRGLGHSATAHFYGIADLDEARAYWQHPLLGRRLRECCEILSRLKSKTASQIFGYPDDLKLHSSLTLFIAAAPAEVLFQKLLDKYFGGKPDAATIALLKK